MSAPHVANFGGFYRSAPLVADIEDLTCVLPLLQIYEGQSKITEPFFITFGSSKKYIYLDDISLQLYVIYLII